MPQTESGPRPSLDPAVVRVLAFGTCGLLVSLKADGRFPFPESLSETAFQLLLVPYTLALIAAVAAFLAAERLAPRVANVLPARLRALSPSAWALCGVAAFDLLTLFVVRSSAHKYAAFGYSLPAWVLPTLALGFGATLVAAARRGGLRGPRLWLAAAFSYLACQIASVACFPLHSGRSDMLPLIVSAVRRLLSAASPYGLHELPHSVPLTYLPGTWLPFVPAVGLGLDPRLVEILATLAATALLVWAAPRERRDVAGALLALFLTTPYVQYRHEIYLGPLWLSLALVAFGDARRLSRLGALALGWAVASSQFVWVIVPVYVAQLARREGLRATLRVSASAGVTALLLVGPFLAVAPRPFVDGVFGHWERTLNVTTANLAYGVVQLVSLAGLRLVQAVAWLTASVVALRLSRVGPAPWAAMAAVLGVFVLFNSVVWVYFYLTVFFLMAASAAVGPQAEDAPARPVQEG